jgi:DNA primase
MKNPEKLRELILKEVDMARVMQDYGVDFVYNPHLVDEAQLRCPFHGEDNKPSARFYKATQSMFCWVCYKRWNVIQFVMEREQIYYTRALLFIIDKYKLDTSSISDEPELKAPKFSNGAVAMSESTIETKLIRKKIRNYRGKIAFKKYRALCCAFYMIMFKMSQGGDILTDIKKLKSKLKTIQIG